MIDVQKTIRSRTVWFNLLVVIAGVASIFAGHISSGGVVTVGAFVNLILRYLTTKAITK